MALKKLPKDALPVGDHWGWQAYGLKVQGWADENGLLHREGAPAQIGYWRDGTIEWESWRLHGEEIEPEYPTGCYQDLQARIGRPAMWALPGNLIPVLLGFLQ